MIKVCDAALIARTRDQIVDPTLHLRLFIEVEIDLRLCFQLVFELLPVAVFGHKFPSEHTSLFTES